MAKNNFERNCKQEIITGLKGARDLLNRVLEHPNFEGWISHRVGTGKDDLGIDAEIAYSNNTNLLKVDIKTDTHASQNLFVEVSNGPRKGWFDDETKQTQTWLYYFPGEKVCYALPVKKFREWLETRRDKYPLVNVKGENGQGLLVCRKDVEDAGFLRLQF